MEKSMTAHGYTVRFRVREMKWRRRRKGRARGFYEGNAVYLRVKGPDNVVRDVYLGTVVRSRLSSRKMGGRAGTLEAPATSPASSTRSGGRSEWQELQRTAKRYGYTLQLDE